MSLLISNHLKLKEQENEKLGLCKNKEKEKIFDLMMNQVNIYSYDSMINEKVSFQIMHNTVPLQRQYHEAKKKSFQKMILEQLDIHVQRKIKRNVDTEITSFTKIGTK